MKIRWERNGIIMAGEKGSANLYKKLEPNDIIKEGAVHSICIGYCEPIRGGDTIGDTPSSFYPNRTFYNKITDEEYISMRTKIESKKSSKEND